MKNNFLKIFNNFNGELINIDCIFHKLMSAYSSQYRFYHSISHVKNVLNELDNIWQNIPCCDIFSDVNNREKYYRILYLSIWFHDAVYIPGSSSNEIESADLAASELQNLNIPEIEIKIICENILSTINHKPISELEVCNFFLDLDLSILGQNEDIYLEYSDNIRKEYAFVDENIYNQKRREILLNFIGRNSLYYTKIFREKYETKARKNIEIEIKKLSN